MAIDILTLALAKKMSGSSGGSAIQSDWNQNDETASDYIKNRPFYESSGLEVISECEISSISSYSDASHRLYAGNVDLPSAEYIYGKEYTIEINGETHVMSLTQQPDGQTGEYFVGFNIADGATVIGTPRFNANVLFGAYTHNNSKLSDGDTFTASLWVYLAQTVSLPATIRVGLEAETLVQLDPKYIKDMYYTETVQKSQTREFINMLEDAEFVALLYANRQTAQYIIDGVQYTFKNDEQPPEGYGWNLGTANAPDMLVTGMDGNIYLPGNISITVNYEEETIHKIDPKYLPDSAKSDWNQNDPTAPDYVKNRPFWTGDPVEKTLFNNDFDIDNLCYDGTPLGLEIGKTYTVCLNEDSYDVVCVGIDGGCFLGNGSLQDIGEDTGEPFVVIESVDHNVFSACVAESYFIQLLESGKDPIVSLEIFGSHKEVTTIDAKYLPVGGRMRRGAMSFGDVVPTEGLEIFVGTTTYASFINHLQSSAIPIFYLNEHGLGGNAMTALVFSYSSSRLGEIGNEVCDVTLSVFDLTYGFSGKIYVTFPLNADNAVDDDSAVESIQFSAPESMVLKSSTVGSEKKFKITVDDSGTLKATELT